MSLPYALSFALDILDKAFSWYSNSFVISWYLSWISISSSTSFSESESSDFDNGGDAIAPEGAVFSVDVVWGNMKYDYNVLSNEYNALSNQYNASQAVLENTTKLKETSYKAYKLFSDMTFPHFNLQLYVL